MSGIRKVLRALGLPDDQPSGRSGLNRRPLGRPCFIGASGDGSDAGKVTGVVGTPQPAEHPALPTLDRPLTVPTAVLPSGRAYLGSTL